MSYYKESGKVNFPLTLIWTVVFGAILAAAGYGYGFITELNPFIYLNIVIAICYAIIAGVFLNLVKRTGKIRNFSVAVIVGFILALVGLYAVWVGYIAARFNKDIYYAIENFTNSISILSNTSFSVGRALRSSSIEFSGGMLYALWIVEALILVAGPLFMLFVTGKGDSVYCEDCNKWADKEVVFKKVYEHIYSKSELETIVTQNALHTLFDLPALTTANQNHFEIELLCCGNCHSRYYLKVDHVKFSVGSKGALESDTNTIFPYYEIDPFAIPSNIKSALDNKPQD